VGSEMCIRARARVLTHEKQTVACPWLDTSMSELGCSRSQNEHWMERGVLKLVVNGQSPHAALQLGCPHNC